MSKLSFSDSKTRAGLREQESFFWREGVTVLRRREKQVLLPVKTAYSWSRKG